MRRMSAGPLKCGLHNPLNERHETWVGHQRLYLRVTDVGLHVFAMTNTSV